MVYRMYGKIRHSKRDLIFHYVCRSVDNSLVYFWNGVSQDSGILYLGGYMTRQKLASVIAKRESKKSQVKIGDVREVLKILVELEAESIAADPLVADPLVAVLMQTPLSVLRSEALAKLKK